MAWYNVLLNKVRLTKMADLGIIFLRRKHTIHWYQSLFTVITGSMPFRYFWATLYISINNFVGTSDLLYLYKSCRFKFVTPVHSMKFPLTINDSQATDKIPTSRKSKVCERAERLSERSSLDIFFAFLHLKTAISFKIFHFWYFVGKKGHVCRCTVHI